MIGGIMNGTIVLVEQLDSQGRVQLRERFGLGPEKRHLIIGRSLDADVTLDDAHVAARHASVAITPEGRLLVSDLGTVNGIVIAGRRRRAEQDLPLTDGLFQVGRTRLRVRTTHDSLAPERPDQASRASALSNPAWIAGGAAVICVAQIVYKSWLGAPRDLAVEIVTALSATAAVVAVWVAVWALLSRIMQGEWRWLRHAAIFLGIAVVTLMIDQVLDLGWFSLSLAPWSLRTAWLGGLALGGLLYLHLIHASTLAMRTAALVACLVPALAGGAGLWLQERSRALDVNHIGANQRIYPPALRLRSAGTLDDYFRKATALRAAADEKRRTVKADNAEDDD